MCRGGGVNDLAGNGQATGRQRPVFGSSPPGAPPAIARLVNIERTSPGPPPFIGRRPGGDRRAEHWKNDLLQLKSADHLPIAGRTSAEDR